MNDGPDIGSVADRSEARRRKIFQLHFTQGYSSAEIAKEFKIPRSTVEDDISAVRASLASSLVRADPIEMIAVDIAFLSYIREQAMRSAMEACDALTKNEFLRTGIMASDCRGNLLSSLHCSAEEEEAQA